MGPVPRLRPPHVHREESRHGRTMWYVRHGKGPRIRLEMGPGEPGFDEAYQAALRGERAGAKSEYPARTLGWLIARYRESSAWTQRLSMATRRQRENIFKHVLATAGREPIARIDRASIVAGRDRRKANAGRHFLQAMRGLFTWATEAGHAAADPTAGLKAKRTATEGHATWPESWCRTYEQRWALGTRERLAYEVLRETGLRRGDAVLLGRPHVKNGVATIRTEKTGEQVTIAITARLKTAIAKGPIGELTFIAGEAGRPLTKESFGTWFREACRAAGIKGSAHGLRKSRATMAAENGATVAELDAMFGWRGGGMAALYTRKADRTRLALQAAAKLEPKANIYSRTLSAGKGMARKPRAKTDR